MAERPTWQSESTVADLHHHPLVLRATLTWDSAGRIIGVQPGNAGELIQAAWLEKTLRGIDQVLQGGMSLESLALEYRRRLDVIADLLMTERARGIEARAALAGLVR